MFGEDVITGLYNYLVRETGDRFILMLDKIREQIFSDCYSSFLLGCQGPDIFYHSQSRRPVAIEYGSLLHRRSCGFFSVGLLKKGQSSPEHASYALGFMTHAILDRICHPYIIYHCGGDYHSFFERIIDVLMLKELRGLDPASWDREKKLANICESPPQGLKELIADSLAEAFPERVNKDKHLPHRIDNALADCSNFYSMTSPSKISAVPRDGTITRRSLNYVYPENLPGDIDFLNLNHKPWRYPYVHAGDQTHDDTRSFLDVYHDAVKTAVDALAPCIILYLECGIFPVTAAAGKIGNDSLSIQDEEGRPCAPNLTNPLPLVDVLNQQAKLRGVQ
jgi:hypothetical protein